MVGLPNSFLSLHHRECDAVEGTIHLGNDLGSLYLETIKNYHHDPLLIKRGNVLYHTADLIPKAERDSRRLRKRQNDIPVTMDAAEYIHRIIVAMTRFLRLRSRISTDGTDGLVVSTAFTKRQDNTPQTMDAAEYMKRIVVALTRYIRLRPHILQDGSLSNSNNFTPNIAIDSIASTSSSLAPAPATPQNSDASTLTPNSDPSSLDATMLGPVNATLSKRQQFTSNDDGSSGFSQTTSQDPNAGTFQDPNAGYTDQGNTDTTEQPQNVCVVGLIADNSFYQIHGEDSESIMMGHIASISGYYQQQIGIALAVGFTYIARGGDDYGFNAIPNDADTIVPYINAAAAKIPGMDADNKCIIATFSSSDLSDGAVGVSYVGTVCQPGGQVLIIQDRNGAMVGSEMTAIGMHEIGHSFGSPHDDQNGQCDPTPGGTEHFVMYPIVSKCADMHTLSSCSINSIQTNLQRPEAQCWAPSTRGRSGFRSKRVPEGLVAMWN